MRRGSAFLIAVLALMAFMLPEAAHATAIVKPVYVDYTLMGGSTSVNSPSGIYDYSGGGVICDTFRIAQGVLRDTGQPGATFYDPIIWPLTQTHALTINLPAGLGTTRTQAYPAIDSTAIQLPGRWTKFDVSKASADTAAATTYVVVGRKGPPVMFTRPN